MITRLSRKDPDVILVTGDYYIDHPTFGIAIIARILESMNLNVWIVSAPDPKDNFNIFSDLPKPKLFFGVTSGNIDSTLNLYTVNKVRRKENAYLPSNADNTAIRNAAGTYCNKIRSIFKDSLIIGGGLEISLKRFAHYDFFSDKINPSFIENNAADLCVYGMGDITIKKIVNTIKSDNPEKIFDLDGIYHKNNKKLDSILNNSPHIILPSYKELITEKSDFLKYTEQYYKYNQISGNNFIIQKQNKHTVIINPPARLIEKKELDKIYSLPFKYTPLPDSKANIKAFETIRNTVVTHRGCGGGCSYCSITLHQGKKIYSRSIDNIIHEIKKRKLKTISDLQAPTSNMYNWKCSNKKNCFRRSCIYPDICHFLDFNSKSYYELLKEVKKITKNAFISSGIRYDVLEPEILEFLFKNNYISGQIKVAPEHSDPNILKNMFKPDFSYFIKFVDIFKRLCKKYKKDMYIIPYIISSFPGANIKNTEKLKKDLQKTIGFVPMQIQDFTPTPSTIATAMYYKNKLENKDIDKNTRKRLRNILQNNTIHKKHRKKNNNNKR